MSKKKSSPQKKAGKRPPKATKKPTAGRAATKKTSKTSPQRAPVLGRPTITVEEKLFMLFHDDYHARQIFEFLRAETVGDLEQFTPQEIIHRLSRPIRETVDRIRIKLAERNRCLKDDAQFAADHNRVRV